ncbi:MAG: hypothetical protein KKA19_07590, partial [Candidatus Margulisbacteria bacterium]|nr:hypothetical protein [Candidatus Margulisiibacteriota bacterium]
MKKILLTFLFIILSFNLSIAGPDDAKPSPYNFGDLGLKENIDPKNGALTVSQTDIRIPGRSGLDLIISRFYNSKTFTNAPLSKSTEDKPWSGWLGNGWQFNIGGKLIAITRSGSGQGAPNELVINVGGASYNLSDPEKDGTFVSKAKGGLEKANAIPNGYELIVQGGIKYCFEIKYYNNYYRYENYWDYSWGWTWFGWENRYSINWNIDGYYLTRVEDKYGNKIDFEYEKISNDESYHNYYKYYVQLQNLIGIGSQSVKAYEKWWGTQHYHYRPKVITDTLGRNFNISYGADDAANKGYTQITEISYLDSNGQNVNYQYKYDANNYLIEVVPPLGKSMKFNYSAVDQGLGGNYKDTGTILTSVIHPSGARTDYTYNWYDPKNDSNNSGLNLTDQQSERHSSYIIKRLSRNNGAEVNYEYPAGVGLNMPFYKPEFTVPDEAESMYFKQTTITDTLDSKNNFYFDKGWLSKQVNGLGHWIEYTYDPDDGKMLKMKSSRGGPAYIIEYSQFDEYNFPGKIINYGDPSDPNDDQITYKYYLHNNKSLCNDENLLIYLGLITEEWQQNPSDPSDKRGHFLNTYDAKGNIVKNELVFAGGSIDTTYEYDDKG